MAPDHVSGCLRRGHLGAGGGVTCSCPAALVLASGEGGDLTWWQAALAL